MTAILCSVAVLLCVITMNEACSCKTGHPQERFCFADFVIRAKVLSQKAIWFSISGRVFNLEISQIFKGASRVNQTEGIHVNGSGQGSLFAKAYTYDSACGVWLQNGTAYLLSGFIHNVKPLRLMLNLCTLHEEWSQVTPSQRDGLSRVYGQNCECKISGINCTGWYRCGKLSGCTDDWKQRFDSYCVKDADGTTCSWQNSTSKATNMTFYFVVLLYLLIFV
ncbi:hypothetical protein ACROYT_G019631 [Oculina patagonica]